MTTTYSLKWPRSPFALTQRPHLHFVVFKSKGKAVKLVSELCNDGLLRLEVVPDSSRCLLAIRADWIRLVSVVPTTSCGRDGWAVSC